MMNTKQITPLADGRLELRYAGQLVGYAATAAEARETLNTIAYDAEHGRPPVEYVLAATPAPIGLQVERREIDEETGEAFEPAWTTYKLGGVELDVSDAPSLSVCLCAERQMMSFARTALCDLYALLSHPHLQALLGLAPALPPVQLDRLVCDDRINTERYGTEIGTDFIITSGDERVTCYFPDVPSPTNYSELLAFGKEGVPLEQVDRVLPMIQGVMRDPRVIQMRERVVSGLAPWPLDKAA